MVTFYIFLGVNGLVRANEDERGPSDVHVPRETVSKSSLGELLALCFENRCSLSSPGSPEAH